MARDVDAHFIGVGGAGMSAIARVLVQMGWTVSGSDLKESRNTERLREEGITVWIGHDPANVERAKRVVVSSAIPPTNPEVKAAEEYFKDLGTKWMTRTIQLGDEYSDRTIEMVM